MLSSVQQSEHLLLRTLPLQPIHKESFTVRRPPYRVPHSKEAGDGSRPAAKGHNCPHAASPQVATNLRDPGDRGSISKVANRTCTCTAASHLAREVRAPVWGAIRGQARPGAEGQVPRFSLIRRSYPRDSCSGMVMSSPVSCWVPCPVIVTVNRLVEKVMCIRGASL